jgi:hypothetical protein
MNLPTETDHNPGTVKQSADQGTAGVLFVATGPAHVAAARRAAESVRATNPWLRIAIHSDAETPGAVFDQHFRIADPHARSKVDALPRTPFERTLYLDSDVRVVDDLLDMFRLLETFELAIAHVIRWHKPSYQQSWQHDLPACFPQHNSGVMLYRKSPAMLALFEQWRTNFHAAGLKVDQITLRELLWTSPLRYFVLPPEYNTRHYTIADRLFSRRPKPRILHLPEYNPKRRRFGMLRRLLGQPAA